MPNAPLKHVTGSTVTTVVDPRFGTGDAPTQPAGWGGGTGGGSTGTYSGGVRGEGFHVPPGALSNLTAALANNATDQRVEIAYLGDSTGYGSGPDVGAGGPPAKLRSLLLAAGLTDGGIGSAYAHLNTHPITSTYTDGGKVYVWPPNSHYVSATTGQTFTVTGSGTSIRFVGWNLRFQSYSIDGGAVTPFTSTVDGLDYALVSGLSAGSHTVTVSVTTTPAGGASVMVEFLNATGIVVHNDSVSGGTTTNYTAYIETKNSGALGNNGLQYALGKVIAGATTDWRAPAAPRPPARNTKAAILALGLNDMPAAATDAEADAAGATFATKLTENAGLFIRMCRFSGVDPIIVVPHFESDSRGWRFAARGRSALVSVAEAHGAAWCSYDDAMRMTGQAQADDPHRPQSVYDAEAQFLFDNVLSLALPE